jgi:hypothetical protein
MSIDIGLLGMPGIEGDTPEDHERDLGEGV